MLSKSDIKKTLANCCDCLFVLIKKKVRNFFRTYRQTIKIYFEAFKAKKLQYNLGFLLVSH